ncbi:uncharacterized protein LOC116304458 [Actinia tenebrosa]|uniref:DNA 3'-5' helicase n=1 Tax=Actinia tenebrosa TaxID=6105 RepID=A0A6P8IVA1_ACTTE|nr:uncharacterized protein LOC116304458 [Actinia tenebrosa]
MGASLEESIKQLSIDLKQEQELALKSLLESKDLLAILPTGFGKSWIYEAYASIKNAQVVLVVTPLTSIIKDQIAHLNRSGIPSAKLSVLQHEDLNACKFKILFSSAEKALTNEFTSLAEGQLKSNP